MGRNFKFQAQDSFLEQFFWKIWKKNLTFWKKAPLSNNYNPDLRVPQHERPHHTTRNHNSLKFYKKWNNTYEVAQVPAPISEKLQYKKISEWVHTMKIWYYFSAYD